MYDKSTVKQLLESAIDSLIDNFIREPYLHRVEHSMHCELYSMLSVHRSLQGVHPIGSTSWNTGLIHKEWPEQKAREDKNGRRGNFDLAILSPESLRRADLYEFTEGRIEPDFAVEMGLNYNLDHLINDDRKLCNSGYTESGYLVHLWQPSRGITAKNLQDLITWSANHNCQLAAAVFDGERIFCKHLLDRALKDVAI